MKRKLLLAAGTLMLLSGAFLYWALGTAPVPGDTPFALDMQRLRDVALASGKPLPVAIEQFEVARAEFPKAAVVAGSGLFGRQEMVFRTHILGYPDGKTVVIDPVHDAAMHRKYFGAGFNQATWDYMERAMADADLILATHEHLDHVGGISAAPDFGRIAAHVELTREQLGSFAIADSGFTPAQLKQLKPLVYDDYYSPAPGIALKKAPGHSPGSQLIYVQLASGDEYLFVGDVAWADDNILKQTGRARLVSRFMLHENQQQVAGELAALKQVYERGKVTLVIAHGGDLRKQP